MPAANSVCDVADVEVAARVHRHAVRRDELRWAFSLLGFAKARHELTMQVVHADPMAQARGMADPPSRSPLKARRYVP